MAKLVIFPQAYIDHLQVLFGWSGDHIFASVDLPTSDTWAHYRPFKGEGVSPELALKDLMAKIAVGEAEDNAAQIAALSSNDH